MTGLSGQPEVGMMARGALRDRLGRSSQVANPSRPWFPGPRAITDEWWLFAMDTAVA